MIARACRSVVAVAVVLSSAHCSSEANVTEAFDPSVASDELSADKFVRVARIDAECVDVACPYALSTLDTGAPFATVAGLDLQKVDREGSLAALLAKASDGEILVRGHVVSPLAVAAPPTSAKVTFAVSEAYLGLPGSKAAWNDRFYRVESASPSDDDATDAKATHVFRRVEGPRTAAKATFDVRPSLATAVDEVWVRSRALAHGALVAGSVTSDASGTTFVARQVFVRLPEVEGPCREFKVRACNEGSVLAFERRPSRCLVPTGCVPETVCREAAPSCAPGYTLRTWTSSAKGCAAYACDPEFAMGALEWR